MVAERAENNRRPPWDELSPGVRDAVKCVLNDPLPEELTRRALASVRHQVARYPRKTRHRIMSWTVPAIAASIALLALAACFRVTQTVGGRAGRSPLLPMTGENVAAAFADDLPTDWAYAKAALRSPDALVALDALLDRQSRRSISASSRFLATTSVSPLVPIHAGTVP